MLTDGTRTSFVQFTHIFQGIFQVREFGEFTYSSKNVNEKSVNFDEKSGKTYLKIGNCKKLIKSSINFDFQRKTRKIWRNFVFEIWQIPCIL